MVSVSLGHTRTQAGIGKGRNRNMLRNRRRGTKERAHVEFLS